MIMKNERLMAVDVCNVTLMLDVLPGTFWRAAVKLPTTESAPCASKSATPISA